MTAPRDSTPTTDESIARHVATLVLSNALAAMVCVGAAAMFAVRLPRAVDAVESTWLALAIGVLLSAAAGLLWLWFQSSRAGHVARRAQLVASVLALALPPVGTIWGGYGLWTLWRARRAEHPWPGARPFLGGTITAVTLGVLVQVVQICWVQEELVVSRLRAAIQVHLQRGDEVERTMRELRRALLADGE